MIDEDFKTLEAFILMRLINAEENNILIDANKAREAEIALREIRLAHYKAKEPTKPEAGEVDECIGCVRHSVGGCEIGWVAPCGKPDYRGDSKKLRDHLTALLKQIAELEREKKKLNHSLKCLGNDYKRVLNQL